MAHPQQADPYGEFSEFYDLYVGRWLDDLPLYLEYARPARTHVLEIGAGSGRLTIPLARAQVSVVAVDVSSSMLDILRSRLAGEAPEVRGRVQVVEADACELELGMRYDLIIVPFYTFNYFVTPQAQAAALTRFHSHLSRRGSLLVDVFVPLSRIESCPPDPVLRVDTVDPQSGNRVRGWNIYTMDTQRQMEHRRHIFQVSRPDGTVEERQFTVDRHYLLPEQLEELFVRHGFSIDAATAGYDSRPAHGGEEQLLYVLRRA